jgi:hypothetical protein
MSDGPVARVLFALLRFYKRWISWLLPPLCRYEPSCSEYMRQAIERKGVVRGVGMGLWRILRCNPFAKGGWDPVDPEDEPRYLRRDADDD